MAEEYECGKPCPPDSACEECEGYWQRMIAEGYWDGHRWTERGWGEMLK